jgi:Cyclic nucleotide-binding domain/Recombinase
VTIGGGLLRDALLRPGDEILVASPARSARTGWRLWARRAWGKTSVYEILRNPKYTGYQVFNRRASRSGHGKVNDPAKWVWSPQPTHEPLIAKMDVRPDPSPLPGRSRDTPGGREQPPADPANLPRLRLAEGLRYTPFAAGEVITRQGNQAHWLYLILESTAQVSVRGESGQQRVVAQLKAGDVFGEMALLTSAPRSATVTASSDVECYRLDKDVFQEVLRARRWPRTWPRSWRSATA